jgi:hypothetical protein
MNMSRFLFDLLAKKMSLMNEVIVRLVGGLGNQMFQYAAGRAVAARNQAPLIFDLSWFGTDPERQYALAPFKIDASVRMDQAQKDAKFSWMQRLTRRVQRKLALAGQGLPVFSEKSFRYDADIESVSAPVILDGYFQSEHYFSSVRSLITAQFQLKEEAKGLTAEMLGLIRSSDAICVHIRRGDYVTNSEANSYHGTCSLEYYDTGLSEVSTGLKNPHCFVFSDDPLWVRENFKASMPTTLIDIHGTQQAHEDLRLMRECQHFVIANSSLSWWGAWLGTKKDKRVVAPKVWFKNNKNDTADLIPSSWQRV